MSLPFILIGVIAAIFVLRRMAYMTQRQVRTFQRQLLGIGLCALAAFLVFRGNFLLGLPALGIGAGLLGLGQLLPDGMSPKDPAGQEQQRAPPARPSSGMGRNEAWRVLGLQPGASQEEIRAAHKRLQRANHPDAGGTDYLAAKINQARDVLLNS